MLWDVVFFKKKRNYQESIHNGAIGKIETIYDSAVRIKSWFVAHLFLKTSQQSRKWLISSVQRHHLLIASPLSSPSQKECETNPSG